ncbi:hypothetical protein ACOME3_004799 [Neoechinorhynchus agilis]
MFLWILCIFVLGTKANIPVFIDGWTGKILDCYECHSNQPGCGLHLDWLIQRWVPCDMPMPKCVKIHDNRTVTGKQIYTKRPEFVRGCLKNIAVVWPEMPSHRENGCWSKDGLYLGTGYRFVRPHNGFIFCFCDNRDGCNKGFAFSVNFVLMGMLAIVTLVEIKYIYR